MIALDGFSGKQSARIELNGAQVAIEVGTARQVFHVDELALRKSDPEFGARFGLPFLTIVIAGCWLKVSEDFDQASIIAVASIAVAAVSALWMATSLKWTLWLLTKREFVTVSYGWQQTFAVNRIAGTLTQSKLQQSWQRPVRFMREVQLAFTADEDLVRAEHEAEQSALHIIKYRQSRILRARLIAALAVMFPLSVLTACIAVSQPPFRGVIGGLMLGAVARMLGLWLALKFANVAASKTGTIEHLTAMFPPEKT